MRKITFVPLDPEFRLTPELEETVNDRISEIFEDPGDVECDLFDLPAFTAAEEDLNATAECPACGSEFLLEALVPAPVGEGEDGYWVPMPCCGSEVPLANLNGRGSWGYSRARVTVFDAGNDNVSAEAAEAIGAALGVRVAVIDEIIEE